MCDGFHFSPPVQLSKQTFAVAAQWTLSNMSSKLRITR
jgi:hypothetical protein